MPCASESNEMENRDDGATMLIGKGLGYRRVEVTKYGEGWRGATAGSTWVGREHTAVRATCGDLCATRLQLTRAGALAPLFQAGNGQVARELTMASSRFASAEGERTE